MPSLVLDTPFGISIDLTFWQELFMLPPVDLAKSLTAIFGWAVLAIIFFYMGAEMWVSYRSGKNIKNNWKWVLLAVDVAPAFVQSPKSVEQIFAHFYGAKSGADIGQKFWEGKKQKGFSFEIISIEGYIQFLIRTEVGYRDLVEAAIYAQYPEAEIIEVEDYTENVPSNYPNEFYDIFGIEFKLAENTCFPIRSYIDFQHSITADPKGPKFSDPMAAILENFSRIGHGENFWVQIVVEPAGNDWKEKGIELAKSILSGKKPAPKSSAINLIGGFPEFLLRNAIDIWNWNFEPKESESSDAKNPDLTPGMRGNVQAIEDKISKIGFKAKIRAMYVARKEIFNPSRCMTGFVGALNQFTVMGRNAIIPFRATEASYAFKGVRTVSQKNMFFSAFKKRALKKGGNPYIFNIEELATLWHFPLPPSKTPLIQKPISKRSEPPVGLPVEAIESPLGMGVEDILDTTVTAADEPTTIESLPEELPYG